MGALTGFWRGVSSAAGHWPGGIRGADFAFWILVCDVMEWCLLIRLRFDYDLSEASTTGTLVSDERRPYWIRQLLRWITKVSENSSSSEHATWGEIPAKFVIRKGVEVRHPGGVWSKMHPSDRDGYSPLDSAHCRAKLFTFVAGRCFLRGFGGEGCQLHRYHSRGWGRAGRRERSEERRVGKECVP